MTIETNKTVLINPCRDGGFYVRTLEDNENTFAATTLEECLEWIEDYYLKVVTDDRR